MPDYFKNLYPFQTQKHMEQKDIFIRTFFVLKSFFSDVENSNQSC